MGITLFLEIGRSTLEDAKVEPFYHLRLGDGSFEEIPMGGFETVGIAYNFLFLCCKACNVELAHTQAGIEAMPNGAELLSVYTENDIETYRDVLYYVGQVPEEFFCINQTGKLEHILSDLSVIRYVPFDSDTIENPVLDLGDVLVFSVAMRMKRS